MSVDFNLRVSTPSHVLTRPLDDELVLLNLDNENYYGLDEVSARMWEVLSASPSVEVGVAQLLTEYDVEPDRLRADVQALLSDLVDNGLIELKGP